MIRRMVLIGTLALATRGRAESIHGVVVNAQGRPVPGAQIWTDDPRQGSRADAAGEFTLTAMPGQQLYAAGGAAFASVRAEKGKQRIRLDPAPLPEPRERRVSQGEELLLLAAQSDAPTRTSALRWLARIAPDRADKLASDDDDRAMLLVEAARRTDRIDAALLARVEALRDGFTRCDAAQGVALVCQKSRPTLARGSLEIAHRLWEDRSVGGNDLLFAYAALCTVLAPEYALKAMTEADTWAQRAARPNGERIRLALALARCDPRRAYALVQKLSAPFVPLALARLARTLARSEPLSAGAFLAESARLTPADPAFQDAFEAALQVLLPILAATQPKQALALAQKGRSEVALAWQLRLTLSGGYASAFQKRLPLLSSGDAVAVAAVLVDSGDARERSAVLASLRQRFFSDLSGAALEAGVAAGFARQIAAADPAAARAALERTCLDWPQDARQKAMLAEAMALIDPRRAIQLADSVDDPARACLVRAKIGHFLALGGWPDS